MSACFIIMPISTPELLLATKYNGDEEHFRHVLDHLFIPAVEKAGFTPIPPIAKGADVIHANVIQQLQQSDLVLCDMSSLNANVFFELGIRTAIGKPVCYVTDDATPNVPFDLGVVNYQRYSSSLQPWKLVQEIEKLSGHITTSWDTSTGENMLWKYFSLNERAHLELAKDSTEQRLAVLSMQIDGINQKVDRLADFSVSRLDILTPQRKTPNDLVFDKIVAHLLAHGIQPQGGFANSTEIEIAVSKHPPKHVDDFVKKLAASFGRELRLICRDTQ